MGSEHQVGQQSRTDFWESSVLAALPGFNLAGIASTDVGLLLGQGNYPVTDEFRASVERSMQPFETWMKVAVAAGYYGEATGKLFEGMEREIVRGELTARTDNDPLDDEPTAHVITAYGAPLSNVVSTILPRFRRIGFEVVQPALVIPGRLVIGDHAATASLMKPLR